MSNRSASVIGASGSRSGRRFFFFFFFFFFDPSSGSMPANLSASAFASSSRRARSSGAPQQPRERRAEVLTLHWRPECVRGGFDRVPASYWMAFQLRTI